MKRFLSRLPIAALAAALGVSCAQTDNEDYSAIEARSLGAWIAKYRPELVSSKTESGMYIRQLAAPAEGAAAPETGKWVRIDYTCCDLHGNVFLTRNLDTARREGSFSYHTHYVPEMLYFSGQTMIAGQYEALARMKEGEELELYMPSRIAWGSHGAANNVGYGGQGSLPANKPAIERLRLVEVIDNPIEREEKLVKAFAEEQWMLSPGDTVAKNFYYEILDPGDTPPVGMSDTIPDDSLVTIQYIGRFLPDETYYPDKPDGFVFDTNVDSVSLKEFYVPARTSDGYTDVKFSTVRNENIEAWRRFLPRMRYGMKARIVFVSAYGYGVQGMQATNQKKSSSSGGTITPVVPSYNYYNPYYSGYYPGYYPGYYNFYDYYYTNYNYYANSGTTSTSSSSTDTDDTVEDNITTEIPPYTPLIFELHILPYESKSDAEGDE